MKNLSMFVVFAFVLSSGAVSAQLISLDSQNREVFAETFFFDSFWGCTEIVSDSDSTTADDVFESEAVRQQSGPYQFIYGAAIQESEISESAISAYMELDMRGIDYDDGIADVCTESTMTVTFTVSERCRYRIIAEIESDLTAATGSANGTVTLTGPSGTVFNLFAGTGDADDDDQAGYLQPGQYTLSADLSGDLSAAPFAGIYDPQERGEGFLIMEFRPYCVSDFTLNGVVDQTDLTLFLNAWNAGWSSADVNGDGSVNQTDRDLFEAAHAAGC